MDLFGRKQRALVRQAVEEIERRAMLLKMVGLPSPFLDSDWGDLDASARIWWENKKSAFGVVPTLESALKLSAFFACVTRIARAITTCPIEVYKRLDNGNRERPGTKEVTDVEWLLNVEPNPYMTAAHMFESVIVQQLLGNAYLFPTRVGRIVKALSPVPNPSAVSLDTNNETGAVTYKYTFQTGPQRGQAKYYQPFDIIHLPGTSISHPILGEDVIELAEQSLAYGLSTQEFVNRFFANGTLIGGTIKSGGREIPPAALKAIEDALNKKNSGVTSAGKLISIPPGVDLELLTPELEKCQLVEAQEQANRQIARIMDVPLTLLQVPLSAQGYGRNHADIFYNWLKTSLYFRINVIDQELTRKLWTSRQPWYEVRHNTNILTTGDSKDRASTYETLIMAGVANPNECRLKEGMNVVPGLDKYKDINQVTPKPTAQIPREGADLEDPEDAGDKDEQ